VGFGAGGTVADPDTPKRGTTRYLLIRKEAILILLLDILTLGLLGALAIPAWIETMIRAITDLGRLGI
jgi:hypothetical protein